MVSLKQSAVQIFARLRYGGQLGGVRLKDRTVPTQRFNAAAGKDQTGKAIVFLPGFSSIPQLVSPGALRAAGKVCKADFIRFTHPDLLNDPGRVTYSRMIEDAVAVVNSLPHDHVVLAASSFGAGMMRFVADRVNRETPDKVTGLLGWSAVPPEALKDLFTRQAEYYHFQMGKFDKLEVRPPTLERPFFISQAQFSEIRALCNAQTAPFEGRCLLLCGKDDPVGAPHYSEELARQISFRSPAVTSYDENEKWQSGSLAASPDVAVHIYPGGHRVPADRIRRALTHVVLSC